MGGTFTDCKSPLETMDHSRRETITDQEIPGCVESQSFPSVTLQLFESPNIPVVYYGGMIPGSVSTLSGVPCSVMPLSFQNLKNRE